MSKRVAFYFDPEQAHHDTGHGHPECDARVPAVVEHLDRLGVLAELDVFDGRAEGAFPEATTEQLLAMHDRAYLDRVHDACVAHRDHVDSPDVRIGPESEWVARRGAGLALRAADDVRRGGASARAFVATRPPGHHAERDRAMGFCLYANAALVADAWAGHGKRIAVVDFDVHHGNGTQHLTQHRDDILFISMHEDPLHQYPGSGFAHERGEGVGSGYTLNVPLATGGGDDACLAALEKEVLPRLEAFAAEGLVLSAGFDAHAADPLGHLSWSSAVYETLTRRLVEIGGKGGVVSLLEGGYDLDALPVCVAAHLRGLTADAG